MKDFKFVPETSGMLLAENPEVLGEMGVEGLEMPLDGFLYIYVNNESAHDVQFDNLRIRYNPGQLLQVNHYYPYGLPIKELSTQPSKGKPYNDYMMTTKEWNTEFGLNEYDFGARSYDPAIARWYVQDPAEQFYNPYLAIGNNPAVLYDPDGRFVPFAIGLAIGLGGVLNTAMNAGNINNSLQMLGYFAVGATAGGLGASAAATIPAIGFAGGALSGAYGGSVGGFLGGAGNSVLQGKSFSDVMKSAFIGAGMGAGIGGLVGGISGGITAEANGGDFWSGKGTTLSSNTNGEVIAGKQLT